MIATAEKFCEKLYDGNITRDRKSRYIVCLIFTENIQELGHSRELAVARQLKLEKKLKKT